MCVYIKILFPGSRSTNIITLRNTWLTALGNDGVDCGSHKLIGMKKVSDFLNVRENYIFYTHTHTYIYIYIYVYVYIHNPTFYWTFKFNVKYQ